MDAPWQGDGSVPLRLDSILDVLNEHVEEKFRVSRSRGRLGVELDREEGLVSAVNALVAPIVGVLEELLPVRGKRVDIDLESVVLARNVAPAAVDVCARDVLPSIAVLHFRCLGSRSESEQLVAQTDTEYRFVLDEELTEALDGGLHHGRIARSVRDEQPVEPVGFLDKVVVPGDDVEFNTTFGETADLIVFHAHINGEDA